MEETYLTPLVSICVPAYNCSAYIADCIGSVLAQTYEHVELIVVDDGSTDDTPVILDRFQHPRVRIYHQANAGAAAARNAAYRRANGQLIKFLDGDDLISPQMIETQVKLALANKNSIVSSTWGRFYDNDQRTFKLSPEACWQTLQPVEWLCSSWKNGHSMTQSGIFLLPKEVIELAGYWDEQLSLVDDLDFFTRAILQSSAVVFDPDSILYYRSGNSGSLSDHKQRQAMQSAFRSLDKATTNLLSASNTAEARQASANIWQHYIHTVYPRYPDLVSMAENNVAALGGSNLHFFAGGYSKILVSVIGWKMTSRIKYLLNYP